MSNSKKYNQFIRLLACNKFFIGIVIFLILESLWIALSSHYPMAFDEDYHLGIIKLYASHISPFWSHQPANADQFGAIARDPSYLYQYLMSFIYRLITLFTHDQNIIVIIFRIINISFFACGLYLFKSLLSKTKASAAIVNTTLLVFVLIPVTPLLAAQINYDNLAIPLTAITILLAIKFSDTIRKKRFKLNQFVLVIAAIMLTSLVKYAFLPIGFVLIAYILYRIYKEFGYSNKFRIAIKKDWVRLTFLNKILLFVAIISTFILFSQRYFVNIIDYGTPLPDCSKVLTKKQCKEYGPWIRDYNFKINRIDTEIGTEKNIVTFTADWFYGMWLRLFFTIDGPATLYQSRGPLPIPSISAIVFLSTGIIAFIFSFKKLLRKYDSEHVLLLLLVCTFYLVSLLTDEFKSFIKTGQPVAINGRYLLPILPIIILLLILAVNLTLKHKQKLKLIIFSVAIFCLLDGGGVLTYILRSNDAWYWKSQPIYDLNHAVQTVLGPITPSYNSPTKFLK